MGGDYAPAEVLRCANGGRMAGLKLHLANSDVDLRSFEHRQRLGRVFATAAARDFPILIHMRTRAPDYGARDVELFIRDVLSRAPELPVQIAHMAGWGGYDENTVEALDAWIAALDDGDLDRSLYSFDLAAVAFAVPEEEVAELPFDPNEAKPRLAEQILALGPDRVLFASDWDGISMSATLFSSVEMPKVWIQSRRFSSQAMRTSCCAYRE